VQAGEEELDQGAGVVAAVGVRADAQVPHAAHKLVGVHAGADLAGVRGRVDQLRADRE